MQTRFPGVLVLAALLGAAAPAAKPVITLDGVTTAVKLDATVRSAIARQVSGLNAGLVKIVAIQRSYATASAKQQEQMQRDMKEIHEHCMALHDEIVKQLDPDQRAAFYAYMHAQMKAAGIDPSQFKHDGMMSDSTHDHGAMHGAMAGAGHGS